MLTRRSTAKVLTEKVSVLVLISDGVYITFSWNRNYWIGGPRARLPRRVRN